MNKRRDVTKIYFEFWIQDLVLQFLYIVCFVYMFYYPSVFLHFYLFILSLELTLQKDKQKYTISSFSNFVTELKFTFHTIFLLIHNTILICNVSAFTLYILLVC